MSRLGVSVAVATLAASLLAVPAAAEPSRERRPVTIEQQRRSPGTGELDPSFGVAERAAALADVRRDAARWAHRLGLTPRERLRVVDVVRDADGTTHLRFDRTYAGLTVVGGDLVVHVEPDGDIADTDYATDADVSAVRTVRARVPALRASSVARRAAGLVRVQGQTQARRVVYAVGDAPRLAWESVVTGQSRKGPQRTVVYVDAVSGTLVNRWSLTHRADGTGRALYSGTVGVQSTKVNGRYRMRDNTRGGHRTHDAGSRPLRLHDAGSLFIDPDNRWGNGTTSSRQSAAVDAHFGVARTWDFFRNRFNRRGVRNDGAGVLTRVHYGRYGGAAAENAFWDDRCFCITLGTGSDFLRPLVALDVVAHEMTHGITSHTARLLYFGESGGLDEATSDIFGTMVEFSARRRTDPGDYYLGEQILKVRPGYIRRMDRPAADGLSYNCWTPTMGRDDVHFTSGPANHFFYLLAEGSGVKTIGGRRHDSPTCNGARFGGIGKGAAARIWYRALTVYMTSTTDYRDARDATVRAARDIFGVGSANCRAVTRAWEAVRVTQQNENCFGAVPAPTGPNAVGNPGFEQGSQLWNDPHDAIYRDPTPGNPWDGFAHSGRWLAFMDGWDDERFRFGEERLVQHGIAVPNSSAVELRLQLLIATAERFGAPAGDKFRIEVRRSSESTFRVLREFSNVQASNSYTQRTVDLSAYRGATVVLRFRSWEDRDERPTSFLVDDVSIRGS